MMATVLESLFLKPVTASRPKLPPAPQWEFIDPAIALRLLDSMESNRNKKPGKIVQLSSDIATGLWALNGETVKIDINGVLIDGQNRMHAIVAAGLGVWTVVARGLPVGVMETVDMGTPRSGGDIFTIMGKPNGNEMAATLALVWRHENGTLEISDLLPSRPMLKVLGERHPTVEGSVGACLKVREIAPVTRIAFIHYVGSENYPDKASAFVDRLTDGVLLGPKHPVHLLRETLRRSKKKGSKALKPKMKLALIIKAWNAFVRDEEVGVLRWNQETEPFPEVIVR